MEKQYFSYIRVSTVKQGERGVSLQEQHDAIFRYAERQNMQITRSFQELETAAKRGRPVFNQMLRLLKRGAATGVVIHKIDRGARNLKDWADLGELIDVGVEVHFANESLDLNTRGGRLSADIQAVVAADYIRNLREETKKGFYGRLKQGLYPLRAPLGYLDQGGGKAKTPDPIAAPLVREAFDLYASGNFSLPKLVDEMYSRGLRNRRGDKVSLSGMSKLFNNPFYIGLIRIKKNGEHYPGIHVSIVAKEVFDTVQSILRGKTVVRTHRHEFVFSRMIRCALCNRTVMAELQKGHTYYRCHTKDCDMKTIREEQIDDALVRAFEPLRLNDEEVNYTRQWFTFRRANSRDETRLKLEACRLQLSQIRDRLARLVDAFLDGSIDKAMLDERRASLLFEQTGVRQRIQELEAGNEAALVRLQQFLELVREAPNLYKLAHLQEKRDLVKMLTSNLSIGPKYAEITLAGGAQLLAGRKQLPCGGPHRGVPRIWNALLSRLETVFTEDENVQQHTLADFSPA